MPRERRPRGSVWLIRRGASASRERQRSHEAGVARLPRYAAPGMPQHIIQRGNNRSVLFATDSDRRFFLDLLRQACERYGCQLHAYVLMTNHVHLLMTPASASSIAKVMQSVGRRYVRRFNDAYQRTGTLWEGRYKATLVQTESYLLACYRYIRAQPRPCRARRGSAPLSLVELPCECARRDERPGHAA